MNLTERIEAFSTLGIILSEALAGIHPKFSISLKQLIEKQQFMNPWFTPDNVSLAIKAIADELTSENLRKWTDSYPGLRTESNPRSVGVIMAGNIPLAGFHDFLCVLVTGNKINAKTSSKDKDLIVFISEMLYEINPEFRNKVTITGGTISGFDSVIATGSDNSSRYFEYYFGSYPRIIRKNRSSVAILDGNETTDDLRNLGSDIFSYFGLGCRNVSKIYIPEGYELTTMTGSWDSFSGIINHNKYANNYDYNRAIFLVNKEKFHDTGYLLLKENPALFSPVAVLHYETYRSSVKVGEEMDAQKDKIQCIVGRHFTPFGKAQSPYLWDYADGADTIAFLLEKK